ncbi:4-hydroxybenzoate 3-monooxygenase [Streptomyces sp. NPDC006872]|uniref:4-hydroxybenzoate 3-monooxygenase n=1 Tax=Streptomyces sp. NPDC006872 TaxID=3155720 RepID=UPI0033FB2622
MAQSRQEKTTVVVVGAGAAGLTVANMLQRSGIDCVVLERRDRAYIEQRQRAGSIEPRAVKMFERWGLADQVVSGPAYNGVIEIRVDGESRLLKESLEGTMGPTSRICPQKVLVQNLIATFLEGGGDLRFEVDDVTFDNLTGAQPTVGYRDKEGVAHEIACYVVAGCDGDRGVSRAAIPEGVLTAYAQDYGISWLTVYADVPLAGHLLMGISPDGFAAQFPRGLLASRFYLQCTPGDQAEDWPDERVWEQLRIRLGDKDLPTGPILEKETFPLRSVVYEPMSHGKLFLVGDVAHIMSPVSGKGMNLALHDAEVFATAVRDLVKDGDQEGLRSYSDTCLRHVWNYQEFSGWMTEMLHDATATDDDSGTGSFRSKIARARLERVTTSPAAARAYGELMSGLS